MPCLSIDLRARSPLRAAPSSAAAILSCCLFAVAFVTGLTSAAPAVASPPPAGFEQDVLPLLERYCYQCHGPDKHKGDVTLAPFKDKAAVQREPGLWKNVLQQLHERTMPPASKPQPTPEERERIEAWVRQALAEIDPGTLPKDPGRVTIRRLNRAEYNNTIRDLLGVDGKPADAFPADGAGGGGFDNNADTLFVPPILLEQYLKAAGSVLDQAAPERVFVARPDDATPKREAARRVVEHFATRAFRRPVATEEVERYLKLFDAADGRGDAFEPAVKLALRAVLISPQFLFRIEEDRPGATEPYPIGQYELASRLSYFLWSSMPDEELFKLAGESKLHDPAVLDAQVRRMLQDPRSRALGEHFGTQWLGLRPLQTIIQPDRGGRRRSREYTPSLRDAMVEEAVLLVDSVFREDAGVLRLIDADYTFLNEELAQHYSIPDVRGPEMRRVTLANPNRGGVLGLGAVLTVTSYPRRTSPVLRGKWVLEDLLGLPPPPPPPDVLRLPEEERGADGQPLTLRQRLEKHRSDPNCASCHARMDPIGFGLENFDHVGRWRDTESDRPVDAAGVLTTGESFRGPAELKRVLSGARRDQFVGHLAEQLLAYALGRGLEYYDEPTVRQIAETLARSDYRSSVLLAEIVKSYPFRYRRNEVGGETPAAQATPP